MNFGLLKLWKENKFEKYDAFLLLTNDTEFQNPMIANKMIRILKKHKKVGILSPCSKSWGERQLLKKEKTKYFWFIHNNCYLLRKDFVKQIANFKNLITKTLFLMDQILEAMGLSQSLSLKLI